MTILARPGPAIRILGVALTVLALAVWLPTPALDRHVRNGLAEQKTVTTEDLNGDGFIDSLTSVFDGGSGFGGEFVTLKDGRSGESFAYNTWGSYGQFLRLIPFDSRLLEPKSVGFKKAMERALFPDIRPGDLEGSLAWLLDAYATSETCADAALFSRKMRFKPRWTEGPPVVPASYFLIVEDGASIRGLPISHEDNPSLDREHRQAWLVYYAHNHQGLEEIASSGSVRIFKSAHGVALSEGGRSRWVFVNDEILTEGPEKLRWPSIKKAVFADGMVFIHHAGREEHLFVVDPWTGTVARLKTMLFPGTGGDFDIREGRLLIRGQDRRLSVGLGELKAGLAALSPTKDAGQAAPEGQAGFTNCFGFRSLKHGIYARIAISGRNVRGVYIIERGYSGQDFIEYPFEGVAEDGVLDIRFREKNPYEMSLGWELEGGEANLGARLAIRGDRLVHSRAFSTYEAEIRKGIDGLDFMKQIDCRDVPARRSGLVAELGRDRR